MENENSQTLHQSHQQYWSKANAVQYPNQKAYDEDQILGRVKEQSTFDCIKILN